LDSHGTDKDIIGPLKVLIFQMGNIHVHESFFHSPGSIAATVSKPSGGLTALLDMKGRAYLKLQKVSG